MAQSTATPLPEGHRSSESPPGLKRETDRRRGGRQETDNHRLVRLLRDPAADAAPGLAVPAFGPPGDEAERLTWGAVALATLTLWGIAALLVVLL